MFVWHLVAFFGWRMGEGGRAGPGIWCGPVECVGRAGGYFAREVTNSRGLYIVRWGVGVRVCWDPIWGYRNSSGHFLFIGFLYGMEDLATFLWNLRLVSLLCPSFRIRLWIAGGCKFDNCLIYSCFCIFLVSKWLVVCADERDDGHGCLIESEGCSVLLCRLCSSVWTKLLLYKVMNTPAIGLRSGLGFDLKYSK